MEMSDTHSRTSFYYGVDYIDRKGGKSTLPAIERRHTLLIAAWLAFHLLKTCIHSLIFPSFQCFAIVEADRTDLHQYVSDRNTISPTWKDARQNKNLANCIIKYPKWKRSRLNKFSQLEKNKANQNLQTDSQSFKLENICKLYASNRCDN